MTSLKAPATGIAKRIACIAVCALLSASMANVDAFAEVRKGDLVGGETVELRGMPASSAPAIAANYSILVDSDGKVYFERAADERKQIASITKMMTAVVALDSVGLDHVVKVSKRAADVGESSASLLAGDTMTLDQALIGLMIPSGNDAAVAIAESVGEVLIDEARSDGTPIVDAYGEQIDLDSDDAAYGAFIAKMNEKAKELGCYDSLFTNPHGLDFAEWDDENPYSTARDIATIAAHAMGNETFRDIVSTERAVMTVTREGAAKEIVQKSTDELLGVYDGACGIKTGFTDKAGQCFAGACLRDGRYLFAVVLDSTNNEQRFEDAKQLYEWVLQSESDYALANSDESVTMELAGVSAEVPVIGHAALSAWDDKTVPVTFANPEATVRASSIFGNISQEASFDEIPGGVSVGDVVGRVDFYQNNELIASQDLIACESVDAPSIIDQLGKAWRDVTSVFFGGTESANSTISNKTPLLLAKN